MKVSKDKLLKEIKSAKAGKQTAFSFLLNNHWSYVYGFALKSVENENDAEDLTIQTFSKAFDKIHTFNEKYQFKTWLIAILKNVYIDFLRKKRTTIKIKKYDNNQDCKLNLIIDANPSPEDQIILEQNLAKLLYYVKQLKPHYQQVIQLRFFQEKSYKEIAEQTDEPINNIKIKLLRARRLLAEIIKKR